MTFAAAYKAMVRGQYVRRASQAAAGTAYGLVRGQVWLYGVEGSAEEEFNAWDVDATDWVVVPVGVMEALA